MLGHDVIDHGLEHRHFEFLPSAGPLAVEQRGRDAAGYVHPSGRIAQCRDALAERAFEFALPNAQRRINTWRYDLVPAEGGGTDVTESFRLSPALPLRIYWTLLGWARGKTNHDGMQQTLDRIKAVVEEPSSGS